MDNKIIAILAIAVAAAVGIGAFAVMGGDDSPAGDSFILNGNGGTSESGDSKWSIDLNDFTSIPKNPFTKDGYGFYKWNTSPDGKGTFYTPDSVTELDTLKKSGVKQLYAYWGHSLTLSPIPLDEHFDIGLIKHGLIPDPQIYRYNPIVLDPTVNSTALAIVLDSETLAPPTDWTCEITPDAIKVVAVYSYFTYQFTITDIVGASDFEFHKTKSNTSAGIMFSYSGNVSMSLDISMVYNSVTYDGNGGVHTSEGKDPVTSVDVPCNFLPPSKYFVNEGHTFVKWAENADGTGFEIVAGTDGKFPDGSKERLQNSGVTKLYAIWEVIIN